MQRTITGSGKIIPHRNTVRRRIPRWHRQTNRAALTAGTRAGRDIDYPDPIQKRRAKFFRAAFFLLQLHRRWQSVRVGISLRQFEQMKERLGGRPSRVAAISAPVTRHSSLVTSKIILGIDPSLRGTGYGVIKLARPFPGTLAHGTISCPKDWERSRCLAKIFATLRDVLREYQPDVCVVEGLFFAQNLKTAITMGEVRGAAMAAVAESGVEIFEIATRKVKLAIVGYGAAQKLAVAKMVQRMLNLAELPAPDAADALALALAHAQENTRHGFVPLKKI
jgi:crossover junction endodeoxyribonuclease RuvC